MARLYEDYCRHCKRKTTWCADDMSIGSTPDRCQSCGHTIWTMREKKSEAPDLALLAKFATGEGGRRTGVLMREGLIKVTVTEKGCAALGGLDATAQKTAEGTITHADLLKTWERYGALYDAVFPGVTLYVEAIIRGDYPAERDALALLAQLERCK